MILDLIIPSTQTATAVSSQEDSMASIAGKVDFNYFAKLRCIRTGAMRMMADFYGT
jgi:hypothetical protein